MKMVGVIDYSDGSGMEKIVGKTLIVGTAEYKIKRFKGTSGNMFVSAIDTDGTTLLTMSADSVEDKKDFLYKSIFEHARKVPSCVITWAMTSYEDWESFPDGDGGSMYIFKVGEHARVYDSESFSNGYMFYYAERIW